VDSELDLNNWKKILQTHDELMDRNMFFFFTDQPPSDIHLYRDVLETCILNQIDLQRKLGTTMCISSTLNDLYDLAKSYIKKIQFATFETMSAGLGENNKT